MVKPKPHAYSKVLNGLLDRIFLISKVDPCLFVSKTMIFVIDVDDCLF